MPYDPTPDSSESPFERMGGDSSVRALVERFYDAMSELEPTLARLHPLDAEGRVARESRDKFALFFIGWLGGPQDYVAQNGHPRLRMRHAHVPVDDDMVRAWMRCMREAMQRSGVEPEMRDFLEARLQPLAAHMRNR